MPRPFSSLTIAVTFLALASLLTLGQADSLFAPATLSDAKTIRLLTPEVADFIRAADTVSFFRLEPGAKRGDPRRRFGDQRLTGTERTLIVAILADPTNYYYGLFCIGEPPARYGFDFKKNGETLTIIPGDTLIDGGFQGHRLTGALSDSGSKMVRDWVKTYAAPVSLPDE